MPATVVDSLSRTSVISDPLRNFKFLVNINHRANGRNLAQLGFMSVSGLNVETSVIAYRQGGYNTTTQKMPGQSDFTPLTMSRGVMVNTPHAYEWVRQIFSVIQGSGTYAPRKGADFRCNIDIFVLAHPYTRNRKVPIKLRFKVYNAWPASIGFSDLDAGGNAVMLEQMVIQHEGWRPSYAPDPYMSDAPNRFQ